MSVLYHLILSCVVLFFCCLSSGEPSLGALVARLNQATGNVNAIGSRRVFSKEQTKIINTAIEASQSSQVTQRMAALENSMERATRVLVDPKSSTAEKNFASSRIAQASTKLNRLRAARAGLVKALNGALRTTVAQSRGVTSNPSYAVTVNSRPNPKALVGKVLKIVQVVQSDLSGSGASGDSYQTRLARGIREKIGAKAKPLRALLNATQSTGRSSTRAPLNNQAPDVIYMKSTVDN